MSPCCYFGPIYPLAVPTLFLLCFSFSIAIYFFLIGFLFCTYSFAVTLFLNFYCLRLPLTLIDSFSLLYLNSERTYFYLRILLFHIFLSNYLFRFSSGSHILSYTMCNQPEYKLFCNLTAFVAGDSKD